MLQDLIDYAEKLKKNGFKIYTTEESEICIFFENTEGKLGYCECRGISGFYFSTIHKPNIDSGTGYFTDREVSIPTIEHAERALMFCPNWRNRSSVIKYKNFEDYKSRNKILKYVEI